MSPTLEKPLHNPGESPATPKSSEPIPVEDLDLVVDFGTEDNNDDLEEIGGGIEDDWGDLEDDVHETETMLTEAATEVASEEAKKEIEELAQKVKKMSAAVLEKVSEQLGSNRGGWYEHKETKERYYIKFYTNPDQARAEFITNAIYEKLGMGAVRSELFEMDGQLAIASKEISGAKGSNREELKTAADVRNGFIADAYLGNWDVVGLVFDNIVKGEDGRFYRIDNGGSLTFRAQGSAKDFSPNDIPELKNMQRHEFPAGQIFDGLTDEDMRRQAARLLDSISDADIDAIIATSGMTGDTAETIRAGLKGRRTVLRERFGVKQLSKERIPVAMEKLREQAERVRNVELRPRVGILADSDKIENQQVDVIDVSDEGRLELNFKLTGTHYERIRVKLQRMYEQQEIPSGSIRYGKAGAQRYSIADSWDVSRDGVTLHFAQGRGRYGEGKRSAHGLVTIEVQRQGVSQEEIARRIDAIVVDILEIPDGLTPPETSAETAYKWARYAWHHKLDAGTPPSPEILQRLRREEVVPGYFTIVDPEKHAEYEAISPYAVYHQVQHVDIIPKIVQAGGLLSTHERYRRGLILSGMSSGEDLGTGGADSVFTRTITEAAHVMDSTEIPQASFVFEPSLMDRTDWYAYDADRYGNTSPEYFQDRQTPNDVFERQKAGHYRENNEQMFRLGIAMKDVRAIVCQRASWRLGAETTLRDAGVTDIDTLLVGTAEEVKQRCAEHGLRFVGGVSVEEYIRTEVPRQLKHMANIIREVVEWNDVVWWPKVQAIAPDYKSKNEFIRISDFATLRRSLEQAGVTPSDVNPEWSGSWDEVVKSQVSKIGRGICDELQRSEIETVGGKSIDMLRDMDLRALAEALEAQGIEKLWGTDIHEIIGDGGTDPRQQTLTALREAGITNINGKPIEEFVIEAKTYGDFIDITRGAPLRSSQKKEVPVAQGEQNLPPPPPANPLV